MASKIDERAKLIGDKELMAFFKKLGNESKKKTLVMSGLRGAASIIVKQARANARARGLGKNIPRAIRIARVKKAKSGQHTIKFGLIRSKYKKEAFYAYFFEYGTATRRPREIDEPLRFKTKDGHWVSKYEVAGTPPKPFWRPALDLKRDEASKKLTFEMKRALVKFVNREHKKIDIH